MVAISSFWYKTVSGILVQSLSLLMIAVITKEIVQSHLVQKILLKNVMKPYLINWFAVPILDLCVPKIVLGVQENMKCKYFAPGL